ncbi:MAG: hypothetical protein L0227_15235 [Chloroflexi bacterium]|nr:hypothetical protein [Chloroflexota bacterium]
MSEPAARVNFFPGQFLRTQDLVAEQQYHLSLHRRHQVGHHSWGIVRGLDLIVDGDSVFVLPGLAIDGFGRDIVLTERREIPLQAFIQRAANELEIWLSYGILSGESAPAGYADCDADPSRLPGYRWLERPDVRFAVPDPAFADRRRPRGLTAAELAFGPTQTAPDDPAAEWLLYLGLVRRAEAGVKPAFVVDPTGRPYAGLVGESIVAPSDAAWLEIGVDPAENRDPTLPQDPAAPAPRRFGVFLPGADVTQPARIPLSVDRDGNTDVRGNLTVEGTARVVRGTLAFDGRPSSRSPVPWSIYRATIGSDQAGDELRIEMAPGNGINRVAVGAWSRETGQFKPCLTVADDCTVTVDGDLIVEDSIVLGDRTWTADGDARLTVQADTAALRMVESGISGQASGAAVGQSQLAMRTAGRDVRAGDAVSGPRATAGPSTPVSNAGEAVAALAGVEGSLAALAVDLRHRDPSILGSLIEALEAAISSK